MPRTWNASRRLVLSGASLSAMIFAAAPVWAQPANAPPAIEKIVQTDESASGQSETTVEAVTVTGTSIRGVPPTGSNLVSVTSEDVKAVGAVTVPDLLATVPLLSSFNTAPRAGGGGFSSFAPALRGLPATATLPLINGHRLVGAAANTTEPDYPNIPGLAMSRVEIVPDGASSIYGSDAIAGVVNFITRKNYTGVEASLRYGFADDYKVFTANALTGKDWGSGSVLLAYEFTKNDDIIGADRTYRIAGDFRPYGGVDRRATNCPLPNVRIAATGTANYAYPGLVLNTTNFCDGSAVADLYPASRLQDALLSVQQKLSPKITFWGDLLYSDRLDKIKGTPSSQNVTIPNTNPFFLAPPGTTATSETVLMRLDSLLGTDHTTSIDNTKIGNSTLGVDVSLPRDLKLSTYVSADWSFNFAYIPGVSAPLLTAAANGTTTATALDPFGNRTDPAVAAAIYNSPTTVNIQQRTYVGAMKLDGPLIKLPGGDAKFALGIEHMRNTFQQRGFVGPSPVPENQRRRVSSIYGELFIPIFGEGNAAPLMRRLDLSLSGRYDDYSDFGKTSNPKVGLNWSPIDSLTIRGSYGTSFRAPGTRQLGATVGVNFISSTAAATSARDPTRTTQVNTLTLSGGNRGLQPEEADTYSYGFDWRPTFLPGGRFSMTYFNVAYTNAIATPSTTLVFSDPTFTAKIIRDPTPTQLAAFLGTGTPTNLPTPLPVIGNLLDLRLANIGIRDIDGVDFDFSYRRAVKFGPVETVSASLGGTYYLNYNTQASPASPVSDSLVLGTTKYLMRGSVGMTSRIVNASVFINYRDGITNTYQTPTGTATYKAGSYTTADLRFSRKLDAANPKSAELSLQINDLFNQKPPFFPSGDGTAAGNTIGRFIALDVRKAF